MAEVRSAVTVSTVSRNSAVVLNPGGRGIGPSTAVSLAMRPGPGVITITRDPM